MPFQINHSTDVNAVEQVAGAWRRTLADGERMMVIEWTMGAGVTVPMHQHPHEQCGYVVSGEMLFTVEGAERAITAGMGYLVTGNTPHGARFNVPTVIVDVFSPPREDYRNTTSNAPSYMTGTMKA